MISRTTSYSEDDNGYSYDDSDATSYTSRGFTTSAITLATNFYKTADQFLKLAKEIKKLFRISAKNLYNSELENLKYYNLRCRLLCGLYLPAPIIFRKALFPRSGHLPYWIRKKRKDR